MTQVGDRTGVLNPGKLSEHKALELVIIMYQILLCSVYHRPAQYIMAGKLTSQAQTKRFSPKNPNTSK